LRKIVSCLLALAWLVASPFAAMAGSDTVPYKPGALKEAAAKGPVLLHYKSTW
jgi:hypothetical protein